MNASEVVIIGGGISGLSTCYFVKKLSGSTDQKIHLTLLEADNRLGGKVLTDVNDGLIIEGGPDSFFTQKPWASDLCRELGMLDDMVEANPGTRGTFILNRGRLSRLPDGTEAGMPTKLKPFVFTDLISFGGKLRALMDVFIPRRKILSDESIGSFMGRRFGRQFVVKIVEPLYAGIYAGDVYHLSAKATLPSMVAMESANGSLIRAMRKLRKNGSSRAGGRIPGHRSATFVTLKGGMGELVSEIASRLQGVDILSGVEASNISSHVPGNEHRYRISLQDGKHIDADVVVLAVPSNSASRIIRMEDDRVSSILATIPHVSTATVSVAFRKEDIGDEPKGHGFLVPRTEGELVTGCTWESSKWPVHAPTGMFLARCYLGWFGHEEFAELDDDAIIRNVLEFLHRVAGITARPEFTKVYRWNHGLPQYTVGHLERMEMVNKLLGDHPGLFFVGAGYHGVGLPDCIHDASLTAESVVKFVKAGDENNGTVS